MGEKPKLATCAFLGICALGTPAPLWAEAVTRASIDITFAYTVTFSFRLFLFLQGTRFAMYPTAVIVIVPEI